MVGFPIAGENGPPGGRADGLPGTAGRTTRRANLRPGRITVDHRWGRGRVPVSRKEVTVAKRPGRQVRDLGRRQSRSDQLRLGCSRHVAVPRAPTIGPADGIATVKHTHPVSTEEMETSNGNVAAGWI